MKKIFLLGAILVFTNVAQAQRASMVPSPPSSPPPADSGRSRFFTNCLYDDDDYLYVPVEIDPDAPSAQYRPVSPPTASTAAGSTGGYNLSTYVNSNQSAAERRHEEPSSIIVLPSSKSPSPPLGDVARAYRAQKAAAPKGKIIAEQDNNGKIILVPQNP